MSTWDYISGSEILQLPLTRIRGGQCLWLAYKNRPQAQGFKCTRLVVPPFRMLLTSIDLSNKLLFFTCSILVVVPDRGWTWSRFESLLCFWRLSVIAFPSRSNEVNISVWLWGAFTQYPSVFLVVNGPCLCVSRSISSTFLEGLSLSKMLVGSLTFLVRGRPTWKLSLWSWKLVLPIRLTPF